MRPSLLLSCSDKTRESSWRGHGLSGLHFHLIVHPWEAQAGSCWQEPKQRLWRQLTGLLPMACSACLGIQLRVTCSGLALPAVVQALPHQSLIKMMPHKLAYGLMEAYSQLRFPLPDVSNWKKQKPNSQHTIWTDKRYWNAKGMSILCSYILFLKGWIYTHNIHTYTLIHMCIVCIEFSQKSPKIWTSGLLL